MNIIDNFKPISGANDDNFLYISSGSGVTYANRAIYVDYASEQNKLTLQDIDGDIIFYQVSGGNKLELFRVGLSDFPTSMKKTDRCGEELCHIIHKKLFPLNQFDAVEFVADVNGYDFGVKFSHAIDLVIEVETTAPIITYDKGSITRGKRYIDYAQDKNRSKITLSISSSDGLKAISEKEGANDIYFNLRHIVGMQAIEPTLLNITATEQTDAYIRDINVTKEVLLLPNSASSTYNTMYDDVMILSDRVGRKTRAKANGDLQLTVISTDGFDNLALHVDYYDENGDFIDYDLSAIFPDDISDKIATIRGLAKFGESRASGNNGSNEAISRVVVHVTDNQGNRLTPSCDIEFFDTCQDYPTIKYTNALGGVDVFELFNGKTTKTKSTESVAFNGYTKGERHIASRKHEESTELETMVLTKDELPMYRGLTNSCNTMIDDRCVLISRADTTIGENYNGESYKITIDEIL